MSTKYKIPDEQLNLFTPDTPSMPVFDASRCQARIINYETAARMVETYHYVHRVPSIVKAIGMYVDEILAGCITLGMIPTSNASAICGKEYGNNILELTRLFIFDWCGRNSESWLIGQVFNILQKQYDYLILISYADTAYNHSGYIYQATNWLYTGISTHSVEELEDGTIIHSRTANDSRKKINGKPLSSSVFRELYPNAKQIKQEPKYRYIYFLGSKHQRKQLRKALKWPVLPYPKGNVT